MSKPRAKAPFPSLTETWHTDTYDTINPTRPELSTAGKVVVVTGGGTGIGAAIAVAYAAAETTKFALLSRREAPLQETADRIRTRSPKAQVLVISTDLTKEESVNAAFQKIDDSLGPIDILISNAGFISAPSNITDADPKDWFAAFETNVFGQFLTARAFLKHNAANAKLISVTSGVVTLPVWVGWKNSNYVASKIAALQLMNFIYHENKESGLKVFNVHPGIVDSELNRKSGVTPLDTMELPGHFTLWLASEEAEFLAGKTVYCNFDVPEMLKRKDEIANSTLLELDLPGIDFNGWTPAQIG